MKWTSRVGLGAIVVALAMVAGAQADNLVNGRFDAQNASGGDIPGATGWSSFNAAFTHADAVALSSPNDLKLFGPFFNGGGAGVVQGGFAASAGQLWASSAFARIESSDPMDPNNFAVVQLQFLDSGNNVLSTIESPHITRAGLPLDTWRQFVAQGTAPANTATAQILLVHVQLANPVAGGSIFFDNASLLALPEPASTVLGLLAFAGTAGIARRRTRRSSYR
jgi:hypothetical protein